MFRIALHRANVVDMPLYMDIHELGDVSAEDVAKAHVADLEAQEKYCVNYLKYWINEKCGKVFCLVEAPNPEAANSCHREAHGLVARKIIEIQPELADGFLGDVQTNAAGAAILPGGGADARDPGIRTVLFTDIVDSTALTQSMGDEAAMALFDLHDTVVRNALVNLGGHEVKRTGDGIMASFVSAAAAVKCAAQVQRELAKHEENKRDRPLKVRIGAAAGEPVEDHNDLFGCTVQLAARLCAHALPAQILVSNAIAELCLGKGFSFQDLGEVILKGFGRPIRAHAVAWADQSLPAAS
jgi:class 3 adenylate cyclase